MIILAGYAYFAVLIWASYKVGANAAGRGIALFIVGALAFVVVKDGPQALLRGEGCTRYSSFADDC